MAATAKKAPKTVTKKVAIDPAKSPADLRAEAKALQSEILEHRRSLAQGELVNPHIITVKRKQVARLLTAAHKAELEATKESK